MVFLYAPAFWVGMNGLYCLHSLRNENLTALFYPKADISGQF
jgi:hypothetical protein